jgi:hypothetical protein
LALSVGLLSHEPIQDGPAVPHPVRLSGQADGPWCPVVAWRLVFRHRQGASQFSLGLQPEISFGALAVRHGMLICGCHWDPRSPLRNMQDDMTRIVWLQRGNRRLG